MGLNPKIIYRTLIFKFLKGSRRESSGLSSVIKVSMSITSIHLYFCCELNFLEIHSRIDFLEALIMARLI